jgi:hypothetical protein
MHKRVHNLKAGDLVHVHGAVFRIIEDAKACMGFSLWYRKSGKCEPLHGPVDVAQARGEWVSGETVKGYFGPDCTPWVFQGNFNAGLYRVEDQ